MSLFHPSPDTRPSETGKSLSEAVFDASSVQDFVPERYQEHFDELRKKIRAFCQEFGIANDALRNVETFGVALRSSTIPAERMTEAVSLFQQLEHLVTHGEPLKETLPGYLQETERLYNLREQYAAQVVLIEQLGILEGGAILGIDGNNYPLPTLEQIAQRLYEQREKLKTKHEQGFTKLLLVPFGMSLHALFTMFKRFLLDYEEAHADFHLDVDNPFYQWEKYDGADFGGFPYLVYNPKSFDKDNHQGQAKIEILEAQTADPDTTAPGWRIHLFQPQDPADLHSPGFARISQGGEANDYGEELPRFDIKAGLSPIRFLDSVLSFRDNPDSPYHSESGMTPEDWMFAFMTHVTETGQPLDNYQNNKDSRDFLLGAFFPFSADVPCAYWDRGNLQAGLGKNSPGDRVDCIGVRTSVIV